LADALAPDLCIIGAGSGGLTVAAAASQLGASVVLIEQGRMGGECLNTGCVPSKALLAAAARGDSFAAAYAHIDAVVAEIAPHDSQERFEAMGVRVIRAAAAFAGPETVVAGDTTVRARRFVIATGSVPIIPPVPGLAELPYLTNETLFEARPEPEHLLVLGAGPVGAEMAQAFRRLGARVSIVDMARLLGHVDPELTEILASCLTAEGVTLLDRTEVLRAEREGSALALVCRSNGTERRLEGSHLLVAAGRRANLDGLALDQAGVRYTADGIETDRRLRTANRRVFAIGDAVGPHRFTHIAAYQAGIVIRNALFRLPVKVDYRAVPWVTFTDPELAHVGLSEAGARAAPCDIRVLRWPFGETDRAVADGAADGLVKAIVTPRGRVLGASILGRNAGELIQPWALAIRAKLGVSDLARTVVPYPTRAEASTRAAISYYAPKLLNDRTRRLVRFLARFG
jgi:pyruvate/2-oxoglutarate dehydrogenase complex dihydrolipoamide dehydrogenase (E3) component